VRVGALAGLTIETLLLIVPSIGIAVWYAMQPQGSSMAQSPGLAASIALGGFMTAVPLTTFAVAARRMDYSVLGFLQFLSPTVVFLLGLLYFKEPLNQAQLGCFVLIWSAMALFVWDLLRRRKRLPAA
jgi:chloramphenicol-sensitive protein RarD